MCTHMSVIVHSAGTHQHAHKIFFLFFLFFFVGIEFKSISYIASMIWTGLFPQARLL